MNALEIMLSAAGRLTDSSGEPRTVFEQARSGDLQAFENLMRRHERQVLGTAFRILGSLEDAQDAAQEVFLRLFRNLKRLEAAEVVSPWLYRVTVNVCNDIWQRRRPFSDIEDHVVVSGEPGPETMAQDAERLQAVLRAMETLGPKERAALVLREVEGLSTREVAAALGSSEISVRTQISTARTKLREWTQRYLGKKS